MSKKGFSLIEIALVLTIVGIMLYGTMSLYSISTEQAKVTGTNNTLDVLERALRLHFQIAGDLPCPADGSLAVTDANFGLGREWSDGATAAIHKCLYDLSEAGPPSEGATNRYIGIVPTRTLNLPDSYMFDSWGNRITYVVSSKCTNSATWNDPATATDCADAVKLNVRDNTSASDRTTVAAYVLISHGKNGVGAWRRNGASRIPRTASTSTQEKENAQVDTSGAVETADIIYRDDFIKDWSGIATADYFDDFVRWKTEAQISDKD